MQIKQNLAALEQAHDLSTYIRQYRGYAGITQAQLGHLTGCSKTQITRMETGRHHEIRSTWYVAGVCNFIYQETGVKFDFEPYLNRTAQVNNKTGYRGVCYSTARQKYMATITLDGNRCFLGYYHTLDSAINIRQAAEEKSIQGIGTLKKWVDQILKRDKSL